MSEEIVTAEEKKEEEKKKGLLERLMETRISYKKLGLWILIFSLLVFAFVRIQPKYPSPIRDRGFKWGYKTKIGYVFPLAYGPEGVYFIDRGEPVYSDIDLYILSKVDKNITIQIHIYEKIQVNESYFYYREVANTSVNASLKFFEVESVSIDMPEIDDALYLAILEIDGEKVLQFHYRYNAFFKKIETSIGDIFITQLIAMITAIVVYLIALAIARSIANVTATPEADPVRATMFFILFGMLAYIIARKIVFEYGIYNAYAFYPLLFAIALISSIYAVSPPAKSMLLINTSLEETGSATIISYKVRIIKNTILICPDLLEFLLYKTRKIIVDKRARIFRAVSEEYDYIIYFDDIEEKGDEIRVKTSSIHLMRVEDYKSNLRKLETLSRALEDLKQRVKDLEIKLQLKTYEEALNIIREMRRVVTWKEKEK